MHRGWRFAFLLFVEIFSTNNQFALLFIWAALSGFVEILLNKNKKCILHGVSMDSGPAKVHFCYLFRLEIGSGISTNVHFALWLVLDLNKISITNVHFAHLLSAKCILVIC